MDNVPSGYAQTLDCLNDADGWDVPGLIADMAECLRRNEFVAEGQLLAALDWMTFRLKECRAVLVQADSELSSIGHHRAVDKEASLRISSEARTLTNKLKGF